MVERRNQKRRRTMMQAKAIFNDKQSTIDCVIRDLSETGARLQFAGRADVPSTFELLIGGEAAPRICGVVWRTSDSVGVKFLERYTMV